MPKGVYKRSDKQLANLKVLNVGRKHTYKRTEKQLISARQNAIRLKGKVNGDSLVKHHLYGRGFSETITVTRKMHNKIHLRAFYYVIEKYGKAGIDDYMLWLSKKNEG